MDRRALVLVHHSLSGGHYAESDRHGIQAMSLFDLTDKTIVVTGARGFIGRPICAALKDAGALVLGLDLGNTPDSERGYFTYHCDVTSLEALRNAAAFFRGDGKIADGLLLLHGIDAKPGQDATVPWRDWQAMLDVNLTGTMNVCRVFGTAMAEAGRGSIVTVGSLYARLAPDQRLYREAPRFTTRGVGEQACTATVATDDFTKPIGYTASKHAVLGLTRHLAAQWASAGVRVNCLSPGGIGSDSTPADFRERFEQRVPLGRMGTPGDLVGAVQFLLSDSSAYITGQELRVDGGVGGWP